MSQTTVTASIGEGTQVSLEARGHHWFADEPTDLEGTDTGPNPYELLLGSLGACTVLTLRMYANHKDLDLRSVDVKYDFTREHAKDCAECEEDGNQRLDVIRADVTIRGSFDEAQRKRLTEIVSRCPVHRTLEGGPRMFETVHFEGSVESSPSA